MFSLPVEKVRCIYVEGSGCYGRNGHEDAAADAALLAKAVGKPVRACNGHAPTSTRGCGLPTIL
jgi:CO/xanthine dehydrogenase Mo-binding subunit